jgi:hypothetical protein
MRAFVSPMRNKRSWRRTQIRPAVQLSGTLKVREEPEAASHPVGTSGVAEPTFKSVKTAGLEVHQW